MTSHPNRSKRNPKLYRTPTPGEVYAVRNQAGLSKDEAARLIGATRTAWEQYESGRRTMVPGLFILFRLITEQVRFADVLAKLDAEAGRLLP